MGSRDLRRIYAIDPENGTVLKQQEAPGIPWAAVALNGELAFYHRRSADDDRYIYRYTPEPDFRRCSRVPNSRDHTSASTEESVHEPVVQTSGC
jgi:hypothetical protein